MIDLLITTVIVGGLIAPPMLHAQIVKCHQTKIEDTIEEIYAAQSEHQAEMEAQIDRLHAVIDSLERGLGGSTRSIAEGLSREKAPPNFTLRGSTRSIEEGLSRKKATQFHPQRPFLLFFFLPF